MSAGVMAITGASRGLGLAMAGRFRRAGMTVVAISRTEPAEPFDDWLQADLAVAADRERVHAEIAARYGRLDLLVNNAGLGHYEAWAGTAESDLRQLFEVNFFAMVQLTQACLPLLKASGGTVINTSSVAGTLSMACMGPYCATKHAVTAFSRSLRMELRPAGVNVLNLVVGRIDTGFSTHSLGSRKPPASPQLGRATAEGLAEGVYRAWRQRRRELVYPGWYRLMLPLVRWFPGWWERANIKQWKLDGDGR